MKPLGRVRGRALRATGGGDRLDARSATTGAASTIEAVEAANRKRHEPGGSPPELSGAREGAVALRERAAAVRDGMAARERSHSEQQRVDEAEAAALEARAEELEAEQARLDAAAELRRQVDAEIAAAAELDAQIAALDAAIVDGLRRAARFEHDLADVPARRSELERLAAEAARTGDAEAILDAERQLMVLPKLEGRLREQVDDALAAAQKANTRAGHLESIADYRLRRAAMLPRQPEALVTGDRELLPDEHLQRFGGRRSSEFSGARTTALQALRALPDLRNRDGADLAAVFDRERRAAIQTNRLARWIGPLDEMASLIGRLREIAVAAAMPATAAFAGSLTWHDVRDPGRRWLHHFGELQQQLAGAVAGYEQRRDAEQTYRDEPLPGPARLHGCRRLAETRDFRFASEVDEAAKVAEGEVAEARHALERAASGGHL